MKAKVTLTLTLTKRAAALTDLSINDAIGSPRRDARSSRASASGPSCRALEWQGVSVQQGVQAPSKSLPRPGTSGKAPRLKMS